MDERLIIDCSAPLEERVADELEAGVRVPLTRDELLEREAAAAATAIAADAPPAATLADVIDALLSAPDFDTAKKTLADLPTDPTDAGRG